ncbi:HAD-IB family phosphatase [Salipaludibacillus sp. CUR1]|uniref:HAD family hydrolase n=1 Tax=Salipaludibacillus sp. CUR1 TaxID=2820003 RepID=UPI001E640C01|nr:HAD family hydrolase [Salipaludibacillus sp. CUR1]MCE7793298.1 HAD-IB family phosphatase [Salipaludibacillus sp. CUR1]
MAVVTVDFDGTLYQGNSFKAMFLVAKKEFTWKEWMVVSGGLIKAGVLGVFKGKQAFRQAFFKSFARSFKGKTEKELDAFFKTLVVEGYDEIHYDLVKKIRQHQSEGDEIIILSGALQPFLHAFIKELDLEVHVISTELEFDSEGQCTGETGPIVNGEEKVRRIVDWLGNNSLSSNNKKADTDDLWAYADSENDLPLLEFVNNPVVVNPDKSMKQIAEKKEWPVF